MRRNNLVGQIFRIIGYITFVLGFIISYVLYSTFEVFAIALMVFLSTFISGMLFVGISEIIFLLDSMDANIYSQRVVN